MNFQFLLRHPELNDEENRTYRNFNFVLIFASLDVLVICAVLKNLHPSWPFFCALAELVILVLMLLLHTRGYFTIARLVAFAMTVFVQVLASLTHGESAGFDYVLFVISVLPMLFFQSRKHYLPLFVLGMVAHLFVKFEYNYFEPLIPIESVFPLYWNIFFTGTLIFIVMYIFKQGYQRSQASLQKQHQEALKQKEEIAAINDSLEELINQRTKKVKEHEALLIDFANINAHRVRSPLARILGLLHLAELEDDKSKVIKDFVPMIKKNAEELNDILVDVGKKLNSLNEEGKNS